MKETSQKTYRILIPGIFDLLNVGHYKYIQEAKQLFRFTEIVIGIMDPKEEEKYFGLVAMTYDERFDLIQHVKYVDEVIGPCPWRLDKDFLDKHRIDFVVDNQFFQSDFEFYSHMFGEAEKLGKLKKMKKMDVPRSSEYLRRVLHDVDLYVVRSIKRGYTLEDLGIGVWKYKYYQLRIYAKRLFGRCLKKKKQKTFAN